MRWIFIGLLFLDFMTFSQVIPTKPFTKHIDDLDPLPDYYYLQKIEDRYRKVVEPIFRKKCSQCHSPILEKKWYHKLPIVQKIIWNNSKKSLKSFNLDVEMPFIGKKTLVKNLKNIQNAVVNKKMPPLWWTVFPGNEALNEDEVALVNNWVRNGLNFIDSVKKISKK